MPEVAQATITVTPVLKGAQETITNDLTSAAGSAGTAAGKKAGGSMTEAISKKMTGTGKALTAGVTTPILAIGTASVKSSMNFESSFAKLQTIADTTEVSVDDLKNGIMSLSAESGLSASAISEAAYSAISAGQSTGDALAFVEKASQLARGGFTDVATATDVMTTALNAYGLSADQAEHVSDVLIETQNQGKTTVDELAASMGKVIPTAAAANVGIEDLASQYVALTKNGIGTAEATTYINSMLNELSKSGTTASDTFKEAAGVSFPEYIASGHSVAEAMQLMSAAQEEAGLTVADAFGSAEAGKAANVLVQHADDATAALESMQTQSGQTQSAFETMTGTSGFQMEQLKVSLENLTASIGDSVIPVLIPFVENLADGFEKVKEAWDGLSPGMQELIVKVAGVAAVVGPLLMVGGKVVGSVGKIAGGIGSIASKIGDVGSKAAAAAAPTAAMGASFGTMAGQALLLVAAAAAIYITAQAISVLVDAAIRITEAGGPAIAVLVGMGAGIVGLMAAAAALGPALTAGAVGIGVFGAAMLGIGAGIDLACQGIAKVTDAISNLVSTIADNAPQINSIVTNIGTTVSGVIETISGGIVSVIDAISGGISGVLDSLSGVIDSIGQAALNAGTGFEKLANAIIKLTNNTGIFDLAGTLASVAVGVGKITNAASGASSAASSVNSLTTAMRSLATAGSTTGASMTRFGSVTRAVMSQVGTALTTAGRATTQFASASQSSMSRTNSALNSTKSAMSSFASSVRSTMQSVRSAFSNLDLASGLRSALSSALSVARSGLSSLRSAFSNTHFSFQQHIKVPHFSMSGKFNAETGAVPTVRTSWYKVAQSTPYLFKNPTLFGAGEGSQDEMLYGRDALMRDIAEASGSAEQAAQLDAIRRIMNGMYTLMQEGQTITIGKRDFARLMYEVS